MYFKALVSIVIFCQLAYTPFIHGADLDAKFILEQPLAVPSPNAVATSLLLTLPPSHPGIPAHYHSGPVVGYVIEGELLFQVNDDTPRIISAGIAFFEKDRDNHIWGANASNSTVCKVFVTVFGRPGEEVTTFIEDYKRESYSDALSKARQ